MLKLDQKLTGAMISVAGVMISGAAFAGGGTVLPVPEPGLFGIIAAGAAAVLIAARLRNKK